MGGGQGDVEEIATSAFAWWYHCSILQLVKISVRTVTEEGESPDPVKLVILNPREFNVVLPDLVSLVHECSICQ